jgi:hypothetical protein
MRKFKYVGDEPVDVPALRLLGVEPGQVVEVEDKDISAGLDGQAQWEPVRAKKQED